MSVASTIPNHYTVQYESSFDLALQQMPATFRGAVRTVNAAGERHRMQYLDTVETVDITTRGGDTVDQDIDSTNVSIFPTAFESVLSLDEFDDAHLGQVVLPSSEFVQSQAAAFNRKLDNLVVAAATGNRYLGKNGTTADAHPAGQEVAVTVGPGSGNQGLNFEKVANAKYLLDAAEVPMNDRYIAFRAKQMQDLINDILTYHSSNTSDIIFLQGSNVIQQILGFKVIQTERIAVNSGTDVASVLAWQKNELVLGLWNDRKVFMDIIPTKRHKLQIRTTGNLGATRYRNEGVVEILCDQSP